MEQANTDTQGDDHKRTVGRMLFSYPGAFRYDRNRRSEKTGRYSFRMPALWSIFRLSSNGRSVKLGTTRLGRRTENRILTGCRVFFQSE